MLIELNSTISDSLSKTEMSIVTFINENEVRMVNLSIVDIANETYSSPSTVSRAIRKCGLHGFNELRYRLTSETANVDIQNMGEIFYKSLVEAQRVIEQIPLQRVLDVVLCLENSRRIYIFARGPSSFVGQEFALKLQLLDFNVFFSDDSNIIINKSRSIKQGETLFLLSLNGETVELVEAAKNASVKKADIITVCCNDMSELIPLSTYSLIGFKHAHRAFKEFEVSSRISLYMITRIIMDYLTEQRTI